MAQSRRELLAAASAAGLTSLTGCAGVLSGEDNDTPSSGDGSSQDQFPSTPAQELSAERLPEGYTPQGIADLSQVYSYIDGQLLSNDIEIVDRYEYTSETGETTLQTREYQHSSVNATATITSERGPIGNETERTEVEGEVTNRTVDVGELSRQFPSHRESVIYLAGQIRSHMRRIVQSLNLSGHQHPAEGRAQYVPTALTGDDALRVESGDVSGLYTITDTGFISSATVIVSGQSPVELRYEIATSLSPDGAVLQQG